MNSQTKKLINLILLLVNIGNIYAQHMVTENNQWNIIYCSFFAPGGPCNTYTLRIEGDTTLNDVQYRKIYKSYNGSSNWVLSGHYLRQDIGSQKVYSKFQTNDEGLLYDFGLGVGDSIIMTEFCTMMIIEVDSIQLNNGEWRKRQKLTPKDYPPDWGYDYRIEGIGSVYGPFVGDGLCGTDYSEFLLCFHDANQLLYPENPPYCIKTSTEETVTMDVKVYPNPSYDSFVIESEGSNLDKYILYDVLGHQIAAGFLKDTYNEIDIKHLQSGYYILKIIDIQKNIINKKILKI